MTTSDLQEEWVAYQISHAKNVIEYDTFDADSIRYIGGLDISFSKTDANLGCAYITIYDLQTKQIVYEDHELCTLTVPYISGFLAFRELEHYSLLLSRLKTMNVNFYPDIIIVDGNGILHERGFGSASHIGYVFDVPTIGIGKTLMTIDGLNEKDIKKTFKEQCRNTGNYLNLVGQTGKIYGVALKTASNVENPLFVTIGHKISLETAMKIILATSIYRIPEPVRNSDIKSKLFL